MSTNLVLASTPRKAGVLQRLSQAASLIFRAEQAVQVNSRVIERWKVGRPLPHPKDFRTLTVDGYRRNSLIASCVWEIVSTVGEPVLQVLRRRNDGTVEPVLSPADPLVKLLARPNPTQSIDELLSEFLTHALVTGNGFFHKVRGGVGGPKARPVQLWTLRPDRTKVVPEEDGSVRGYNFAIGAGNEGDEIPQADVIHYALHDDPLDDYYGLAPMATIAAWADMDNEAADFMRSFFFNAGVPVGLLKFKTKVKPADRAAYKQQWIDEHGGTEGWHSIGVMDQDVTYEKLGINPGDMKLRGVWDETEARICAAFGVPPILVGAVVGLMRSTYSNYESARRSFWDETLVPLYKRIGRKLSAELACDFGDAYVIQFDFSDVRALQETEDSKRAFVMNGWRLGIMTLNEVRAEIGLPSVTGPEGEQRNPSAETDREGFSEPPRARRIRFSREQLEAMDPEARAALADQLAPPREHAARAKYRKMLRAHFKREGKALAEHMGQGALEL